MQIELFDAEGESVRRKAKDYSGIELDSVRTVNILTIDSQLDDKQVEESRNKIFTNPVTQVSSFGSLTDDLDFDFGIWVGYKPGVMNPEGHTAVEAMEDLLGVKFDEEEGAYTSKMFLVKGDVTEEQCYAIANEMLANNLIERFS